MNSAATAETRGRILVVEDDAEIRRVVRLILQAEAYEVFEAPNAQRAGIEAATRRPDLLIVDLGLPDGDGVELIRELRQWSAAPVIVLSARTGEADKIAALDAGADDYLAKPFGAGELLARLRAQLRRHLQQTPAGDTLIEFGALRIDLARRVVERDGEPLHLTPIEYKLLTRLATQPDRVITHQQLLNAVWGPGHAQDTHYVRVHMANLLFSRMSTAMIPSWVHPGEGERFLHDRMMPVVNGFWSMIAGVVSLQNGLLGLERDPEARRRLALLRPEAPVPFQMRSALALAPDGYFASVASGKIEPHRGETAGFTEHGLRLSDGREIPCELVILSTGFTSPRFPYLPDVYRTLLERSDDGAQLYRHLLHPRIPRLAFAGQNHGFLHVPGIELSMLWLAAHLRGDLRLPPVEEMEQRIDEIRRWKEEHILFEPSRGGAVSTRFHQYFDVLLGDLGLPHRRKSNPLSEIFAPYGAADYAGVLDEYEKSRVGATAPRDPLPLST